MKSLSCLSLAIKIEWDKMVNNAKTIYLNKKRERMRERRETKEHNYLLFRKLDRFEALKKYFGTMK
jgi:hypothetical protein